jgi:hypothetical protein
MQNGCFGDSNFSIAIGRNDGGTSPLQGYLNAAGVGILTSTMATF